MSSANTTRISLRLKNDVHAAIIREAKSLGIEPATYMQNVLEFAVKQHLSEERLWEIENTNQLMAVAQKKSKQLFDAGYFDEHFTLTVIRELMKHPETRALYESIIGTDAYEQGVEKKSPINMYLGWYIKNAIPAAPVIDKNGKPKRAFVSGEPIRSYTLLQLSSTE